MKNKSKFLIIIALVISVISTGLIVFADQENELEVPCEHQYQITDFQGHNAIFTCEECDESYEVSFTDHVNERGYEPLDLNNDGIVNGKDYGYLLRYRQN